MASLCNWAAFLVSLARRNRMICASSNGGKYCWRNVRLSMECVWSLLLSFAWVGGAIMIKLARVAAWMNFHSISYVGSRWQYDNTTVPLGDNNVWIVSNNWFNISSFCVGYIISAATILSNNKDGDGDFDEDEEEDDRSVSTTTWSVAWCRNVSRMSCISDGFPHDNGCTMVMDDVVGVVVVVVVVSSTQCSWWCWWFLFGFWPRFWLSQQRVVGMWLSIALLWYVISKAWLSISVAYQWMMLGDDDTEDDDGCCCMSCCCCCCKWYFINTLLTIPQPHPNSNIRV